ncbi:MAG: ABC transporter ATP-binding protein [Bdellovibrionaceae bacterium]|nr:ABC transporter ATP-binding protein [Pseudobdellovibrionaceae bacterium]
MSVVKNLCKDFGDFVLHVPDWTLADDRVTVLWGPSGSGKTTIIRYLTGIEILPSLIWQWHDTDIARLPSWQRRLGVVLQHYGLFPHLTARENILFPVEAQKQNLQEGEKKLQHWAEILKMKDLLDRKARVLSGGEQQRVALARALILNPRYLILDEPFSALDESLRADARKLLKTILQEQPIGVLLVTHDRSDIMALAQDVVILEKGRLVARATAEEFLQNPRSE